jgi:outer membrane protein assembly factor BamB
MKGRAILLLALTLVARAADQPQWGEAWTRNLVSAERGLPDHFDPATGKNVKWRVPLGGESHSTPIIAGGRIYLGTNNAAARDPRHEGDRGVLLCLDEKTGALRWQLVVPKRDDDKYFDWPKTGLSSSVTVEGDRVYVVTNRHQVLCLDVNGLADGNAGPFLDEARALAPHAAPPPAFLPVLGEGRLEPGPLDADILWMFDLPSAAGIWPHDGAHSAILIRGDHLYVNTGTGVDNSHAVIRTPEAPSLVVLDKKTGRYLAREDEKIAPNIFHSTWSSPALGTVGGRELLFFCGGDGIVRAFEPFTGGAAGEVAKLKQVWRFDPDPSAPKENVSRFLNNRAQGPSNIYGMPVLVGDRLFVAGGGDVFWGKNEAWLKCLDAATGQQRWSYALDRHTLSTPAVADGLVFVSDTSRHVHCVDAATGERVWVQDTRGDFWASPLVADGKVFIGSRKGDYWILAASREKKVLAMVELGAPISATTTAATGVLYIATMRELLAIANE